MVESYNSKNEFEGGEIVSMYQSAESLREENKTTKDIVLAIGKFIVKHTRSVDKPYQPKSILESRFTPAEEAFSKGMKSCGAIANISAEMLRHLGFEVKLVHGESEQSFDHEWISVRDPDTDSWVEFDLTRNDGDIPPAHKKKIEVNSWEEIREQIVKDHSAFVASGSKGRK